MTVFGFFALVLVSVYWVNRAVRLFDQLISDGQSAWVFLEFTALSLPNVISLALPIAAFVATIFVVNRLSGESELVVMQASGFSPWRLARPVMVFGLIVALMMAALLHVLVPASRAQLSLRTAEIASNVTSGLLSDGTFLHPAEGITFFVREISDRGELKDIFLSDARSATSRTTYTASRAFFVKVESGPKLVMIDGMAQMLRLGDNRLSVTRFADFTYDLGAMLSGQLNRKVMARDLSTARLFAATPEDLEAAGQTLAEFRFEAHYRLAHPALIAFAPLVGFSILLLGGFSRFGLWPQIASAIGALIVIQFVANSTTHLAKQSPDAWALAYAPIPFAAAISLGALWLAARPRRRPRRRRRCAPPAGAAA